MTREEHEKIMQSIQNKLGEENSGLIADDLGLLMTDNQTMNEVIQNKENQISQLEIDKRTLITTNGNLLKQVSVGFETVEPEEPEQPKRFDFKSVFDEKGNFIV